MQIYLDTEESKKVNKIYDDVKTFKDLINTNLMFLNGEIQFTWYHNGPIVDDHQNAIPDLIKLNKYGFFSIDGQSNQEKEEIEEEEYGYTRNGEFITVGVQSIQYISYISGLVEPCVSGFLLDYLKNNEDVYFSMSMSKTTLFDNFPEKEHIYTVNYYLDYYGGQHKNNINNILKNCIFFTIQLKQWSSTNTVEKVLLNFYENFSDYKNTSYLKLIYVILSDYENLTKQLDDE